MVNSNKPSDSLSWWADTCWELQADYGTAVGFCKQVRIPVCQLNLSVDDFSLCVNGKHFPFEEMGNLGLMLCNGALNGVSPWLFLEMSTVHAPRLVVDAKPGEFEPLAFVNAPSGTPGYGKAVYDENLLLPDNLNAFLIERFRSQCQIVLGDLEEIIRQNMNDVYAGFKRTHEDDLVRLLTVFCIESEDFSNAGMFYQNALLLPDELYAYVRKETESSLSDFYREMYEKGEYSSVEQMQADLAFSEKKLDAFLSKESMLIGKLDFRALTISDLNQEVQTDDLAKIAVFAAKDPSYAPYLDKIEEWVKRSCSELNLNPDIVNMKRVRLGGKVVSEPPRPKTPEGVKAKARGRFLS